MLQFSANLSLLFTEVDMLDRFERAAQFGFDRVEIQFPYAWPADLIAEQLQANNLELLLFNVDAADLLQGGIGLASDPEQTDRFEAALEQSRQYAQVLKPKLINVLPGRRKQNVEAERQVDTLLQNLRKAVENFSPLGITTVFEAINTHDMPGFLIHSSAQMLELLERFQHPMLAMQYDIYHMVKMGEDPESFIQEHVSQIAHIQFADCPGRGEPGTGSIDFLSLFKAIEQSTYQGWLGAEYIPCSTSKNSFTWLESYK